MTVRIEENRALGEPGWFVMRGEFVCGYFRDWPNARMVAAVIERLSDAEWQAVIDELIAEADARIGRAA